MHVGEDGRVLDAHADEPGDLEEAAVGETVAADAPVRQPVVLRLVAGVDVVDRLRPRSQRQVVAGDAQDATPLRVLGERDVAVGNRGAVGFAEERQDQLGGCPVDVEVGGVGRCGAVLEDVAPPAVVRRGGHVVGHDVEEDFYPLLLHRRRHPVECLCAAEHRVEDVVIGDVVAVGGVRRRLEHGRGVEVADADAGEMRRKLRRIVEPDAFAELDTVGGADHRVPFIVCGHWPSL